MSQINTLLQELIRRSLQILTALVADPDAEAVDERALLTYKFCQNDNYAETPTEIAPLIRFFPRVLSRGPRMTKDAGSVWR